MKMKNNILIVLSLLLLVNCNDKKYKKKVAQKDYPKTIRGLFDDTPVEGLAKFVDKDNYEDVLKLAKETENVDYRNPYTKNSLLQMSMYKDKYNAVKALLEAGADPNLQTNIKTESGLKVTTSPFIVSCSTRDTALIKLFIKYGGDVNSISVINSTPYKTPLIAACTEDLASVKVLVEAGADPHKIIPTGIEGSNYSALNSALLSTRIDIANYLVFDLGVDYSQPYIFGKKITWGLRSMAYPLDSKKYRMKMRLVNFLKENGMDYYKEPIPQQYYDLFDEEYLSKY